MNIKNLPSKIAYSEVEKLKGQEYYTYTQKYNLFSDLNFIEYFKDRKGIWFWRNVIVFTTLPIKLILIKYKNYLIDAKLYEQLYRDFMGWNLHRFKTDEEEKIRHRYVKNIKAYKKFFKQNYKEKERERK